MNRRTWSTPPSPNGRVPARSNPNIPVLHRNLGRTLLAVKRDDQAALDAFREGLKTDRSNVELYAGLDQAMSILKAPAAERAAALEQYPDRAGMPTPLALELALSYAEAGRFEDAEKMFRNRYFEREEGGANVREVYLEVELMKAMALAANGKAAEARTVLAKVGSPVEGLEFTRDGMQPFLASARIEYLRGEVEKKLGDEAAGRKRGPGQARSTEYSPFSPPENSATKGGRRKRPPCPVDGAVIRRIGAGGLRSDGLGPDSRRPRGAERSPAIARPEPFALPRTAGARHHAGHVEGLSYHRSERGRQCRGATTTTS